MSRVPMKVLVCVYEGSREPFKCLANLGSDLDYQYPYSNRTKRTQRYRSWRLIVWRWNLGRWIPTLDHIWYWNWRSWHCQLCMYQVDNFLGFWLHLLDNRIVWYPIIQQIMDRSYMQMFLPSSNRLQSRHHRRHLIVGIHRCHGKYNLDPYWMNRCYRWVQRYYCNLNSGKHQGHFVLLSIFKGR